MLVLSSLNAFFNSIQSIFTVFCCAFILVIIVSIIASLNDAKKKREKKKESNHTSFHQTSVSTRANSIPQLHYETPNYNESCQLKHSLSFLESNPFHSFSENIHNQKEQLIRMERGYYANFKFKKKSDPLDIYELIGSAGQKYNVSFKKCDCEDFNKRQLPCKHMYFIAIKTKRMNYEPYLRKLDTPNRMNLQSYEGRIKYISTGKYRKVIGYGRDENDFIARLEGYDKNDIDYIHKKSYPEPTEKQKIFANKNFGIVFPYSCCEWDASELIENAERSEKPARGCDALLLFADYADIPISLYSCEERLVEQILFRYSVTLQNAIIGVMVILCKKKFGYYGDYRRYISASKSLIEDEKFVQSYYRLFNRDRHTSVSEICKSQAYCIKRIQSILQS